MTGALYPVDLERSIVTADGTRLRLRPIRPDDAERLVALHGRLSTQTIYQRFFTVMKRLPTAVSFNAVATLAHGSPFCRRAIAKAPCAAAASRMR